MSLKGGFAVIGQRKSAPLNRSPTSLVLDNPAGWISGVEDASMSRDRAMKISAVNRCVEVLGNAVGVLPTFVMNEGTKEHLNEHRLTKVLAQRPNEAMTPFDFNRLLMCNQILRGNAYAWSWRDGVSGHVKERIPLPADYVSFGYDENGQFWYIYTHPTTGQVYRLRPQDVTHYKAYSEDGITGISVLKRASLTLETARHAQTYEHAMWKNHGQPSGILTTDAHLVDYDERQPDGTTVRIVAKNKLRESWEAVHGGAGNALRVAVLDDGLKYQPISMTNSDAQFVESNELRVSDVCRFFGVPPHLVFAGKQSYASNEQNGIEFVTYTLIAYERQWSQEDSWKLLLPSERAKGEQIRRNLKIFLRGDTAAQANWYRTMREISAYSANDILAFEDMPAVPGGDNRYASWNYGPLESFVRLSVIRAMGGTGKEMETK